MDFPSILYATRVGGHGVAHCEQGSFADLHLDQIIAGITRRNDEGEIPHLFRTPLRDSDAIRYRQEVFADLEDPDLLESARAFAQAMGRVERSLSLGQGGSSLLERGWFLRGAETYCAAVDALAGELLRAPLQSRGLRDFSHALQAYRRSDSFTSLREGARAIKGEMSDVIYSLHIRGRTVEVHGFEGEMDLGAAIEESFGDLSRGAERTYVAARTGTPRASGLSHMERQIAGRLADLYPEVFAHLKEFCEEREGFIHRGVHSFARELAFYLAYLDYIREVRNRGLEFCYPRFADEGEVIFAEGAFDLALARKLGRRGITAVPNDFHLSGDERMFVVTGANQGGKTTFARAFGQIHFLAGLGCPVPGRDARLFPFDGIYTHFEREERIANLRGKMEDDLVRIREILECITPGSILILNEMFTSATRRDELLLSERVLRRVLRVGAVGVCVTFVEELATLDDAVVSMVASVDPEDPATRTYKIRRRPPDGLAHAISMAEKHRLTAEWLGERLG